MGPRLRHYNRALGLHPVFNDKLFGSSFHPPTPKTLQKSVFGYVRIGVRSDPVSRIATASAGVNQLSYSSGVRTGVPAIGPMIAYGRGQDNRALPGTPQISYNGAMATKRKKNAPLTDAERHKRFVDMAREVEATGKAKDYEKV